jgi:hypothetical protein
MAQALREELERMHVQVFEVSRRVKRLRRKREGLLGQFEEIGVEVSSNPLSFS